MSLLTTRYIINILLIINTELLNFKISKLIIDLLVKIILLLKKTNNLTSYKIFFMKVSQNVIKFIEFMPRGNSFSKMNYNSDADMNEIATR